MLRQLNTTFSMCITLIPSDRPGPAEREREKKRMIMYRKQGDVIAYLEQHNQSTEYN